MYRPSLLSNESHFALVIALEKPSRVEQIVYRSEILKGQVCRRQHRRRRQWMCTWRSLASVKPINCAAIFFSHSLTTSHIVEPQLETD
jgi:hypothetical protein